MKDTWLKYSKLVALTALSAGFVLSPIFFVPLTTDFFSFQKHIFILLVTAIALIAWSIYNIVNKSVRITISPLLIPLILFIGVVIASLISNQPHSPSAWLERGTLYIVLAIYYLLTTSILKAPQTIKKIVNLFLIVTTVVAFWGILSVLGTFESLGLPAYLTLKTFSPTGSLLSLVGFLITTLPISLILAFKIKAGSKKLQYFLAAGLSVSAIILIGFQLLPNQQFAVTLLPKLAGWSIAIDTLKTKIFFGAGPGNFINQFTQFKPISMNLGNLWAINFATSANEYLQLLTTLGIGGLVSFGLIMAGFFKLTKHEPGTRTTALQLALKTSVFVLLVLGLFIPFTTLLWITLIGYLSLSVGLSKVKSNSSKVKDVILTISAITLVDSTDADTPQSTQTFPGILPWIVAVPILIGIGLVGFNISKVYASEVVFRQSLEAANQNLGGETYNKQIKTLNIQGGIDRYRVAYSNTNFALANSLSQQGDLTDQDQQTITQLIQQSVREARIATQINPLKASNWENLANIYRQLVNFAEGSDEFAVASYTRAIQLDPANPRLRLDLGGLLFSLERFEEAEDRFLEAVQLKPDYANAHYNLAQSYKSQEKYLQAYRALQQVAAIIEPGSEDASKLQEEMTELQAMLPKPAAQTETDEEVETSQLVTPSPLPVAPADLELIEVEEPVAQEATDSAITN